MRRYAMLLVLAATLAAPAPALAGGWASAGIDALPSGLTAGEPWRVRIEILQHGRTPLSGLEPSVRITGDDGRRLDFPARPAGAPGFYVAEVRFPTGGRWNYRIFDGFTDAVPHTFPPVTVSAAGAAPSGGDAAPWPQAIAIGALALLWAGGWLYAVGPMARRRRRTGEGSLPRTAAAE